MSDLFIISKCPICGNKPKEDEWGMTELSGYIGDTCKCSKCKSKFVIEIHLKEKKKK